MTLTSVGAAPIGIVVSVALLLVIWLSRGATHTVADGSPTYTQTNPFAYALLLIAFVFLSAPWWGPLIAPRPPIIPPALPWVSAPFFFFFIWAKRYRVILDKEAIKCGAFFVRQFRYADITRVKYIGPSNKGRYMIYASSSRWPMTIESSIGDYRSFVEEMRTRLPKSVTVERIGAGSTE